MARSILNYFGFGSPPSDEEKTAMRALPANWYTSHEMYELERRAIFSRKWMLITHMHRLQKAGDWLKFDIAGFPFVLCRDREGNINGFHNYHGWSYGLNGKLAKAPGYQELEGFDKSKNGLLRIHVRVDVNGFIWVNLDGKETPEVSWEEDFDGIDKQERYKDFNFDDYVFDHEWQMDGPYNWKILSDNYNECYHCPTTHPDIGAVASLQSYSVRTKDAQIIHDAANTPEQRAEGMIVASTYYFPNVSTNITPHFFMIQRFVPSGPTSSSMQYQVFRNKNSSEESFQLLNQIYKRIMSEDKELCDQAQKNLNRGVFINGEMHPRMEKGPLYFQKVCRDTVTAHYKREQAARKEIWPAQQQLPNTATVSQNDVDFCANLPCKTVRSDSAKEGLVW